MEERNGAGERPDGDPRAPEGGRNEKRPAALKGRLSRGERLVLLAGVTLLVLAGVYIARSRYAVRNQREALLAKSAAEAASLSRPEAEILELVRGFIFETAAADAPGDVTLRELSAPGALEAFLSRPGLYFRAAQPDVRPRFLADAVRSTPKDAFVLCLLAPPESLSDYRRRIRVDTEAFKARTGFAEAAAAQDCYLGATARKHAQQI
jgi:hypothetical protein